MRISLESTDPNVKGNCHLHQSVSELREYATPEWAEYYADIERSSEQAQTKGIEVSLVPGTSFFSMTNANDYKNYDKDIIDKPTAGMRGMLRRSFNAAIYVEEAPTVVASWGFNMKAAEIPGQKWPQVTDWSAFIKDSFQDVVADAKFNIKNAPPPK